VNRPTLHSRASLWETTRAVLWSFLGVRRRSDFQDDVARLNPLHLMAVGVVMALLFVAGLILLVHWVAG
jgi:CHASE2 domain-containing sensor protein